MAGWLAAPSAAVARWCNGPQQRQCTVTDSAAKQLLLDIAEWRWAVGGCLGYGGGHTIEIVCVWVCQRESQLEIFSIIS